MQKKEATILSVEISGLQSLAENLSSEEIDKLMNDIHSLCETTFRLHHGKINQFTGETILSVFQQKSSSKSAGIHAVDAAFNLNDQFQSLVHNKNSDYRLKLKVGIAVGTIVSTEIGTGENKQNTLMGEAVNHATRICKFAGEGQVLVDKLTHQETIEYYESQSLEPIPIKGGVEILPVFELTGTKRKKIDLKTISERKIVSEMVGRTKEAELLERQIKKLITGKGSIVNIVGKAGIGKSRLMAEIMIQPDMKNIVLLEGRALSTGHNLSFHPIVDLIKSWAGITEKDPSFDSSEKLKKGIDKIAPDQSDEIFSFMATMMGLHLEGKHKERVDGIEGEALEKLILKNLRELIISAAKEKPRVYLIEDMHWCDISSIALFESLYKLSLDYPVMFINVMRPGYKETGDHILKYLLDNFPYDHVTIHLSPLTESDSGQLISNLLRKVQVPSEIEKMIIRKTEGNPFFIEEVIRSFIDDGIIEIKDQHFIVNKKIAEVNIPETINEAILSRVDKLDEKTRELLNTASVIGRNFYYKVLEEATDTIDELDERLEYLKEVQLISEDEKKLELEYLFKHALAQQATYESIFQNTKKELHLKIARSIEKVFHDNLSEFYGTLVYHYEKAENKEKTEEYLIRAGDEAMRTGASSEAINLYNRAIKLIQFNTTNISSKEKIYHIEEKLVYAYAARGMNAEVIELTKRILPRYDYPIRNYKHGNTLVLIWLAIRFIWMIRRYDKISKRAPSKEEKFVTNMVFIRDVSMTIVNPTVFLIEMFKYLLAYKKIDVSKTLYGSSTFAVSITFFTWAGFAPRISDKVLALAKKYHNPKNEIGWIYIKVQEMLHNGLVGNWQSDAEQDQLLDLCLKRGEFFEGTLYLVYRIYSEVELGNYESANNLINTMLDIAQKYENNTALAFTVRMKTLLELKFRKIELANETRDEVMDFIKRSDESGIFFALYCSLAQHYTLVGNVNLALEMLNKAKASLPKMEKIKIWKSKYYISKSLVYFELAKNSKEQNTSYRKECLKASRVAVKSSEKVALKITEANRIRSVILWKYGKQKAANKSFASTIKHGEKLGAKLELSRSYFELGKFLSDPQVKYNELNGKPARHYLEKSKSMFEEMDLQWDIEAHDKFTKSNNLKIKI